MIDALTHRINAWIGEGLHRVIHDDAARSGADLQARFFGECSVWTNADRHHHEVGWNLFAAFEAQRCNAARFTGNQCLRLRLHPEFDAFGL